MTESLSCSGSNLTNTYIDALSAKIFSEFRNIVDGYQRGIHTGKECSDKMREAFYGAFFKLLNENCLKLSITFENYNRFCAQFSEYQKSHEIPLSADPVPWLLDTISSNHEADPSDKKCFFRFMESFCLSPDFFLPPPKEIIFPRSHGVHMYHSEGVYSLEFSCADDGWLLSDPDPVGKTFVLTDDMGIRAEITVKEDRRGTERSGMDIDELVYSTGKGNLVNLAEFLGEGYIEGYTAKEERAKPDIIIRTDPSGKVIRRLAYWEDVNDRQAFMEYPLWQEAFRWEEERNKRREEILKGSFEKYLKSKKCD